MVQLEILVPAGRVDSGHGSSRMNTASQAPPCGRSQTPQIRGLCQPAPAYRGTAHTRPSASAIVTVRMKRTRSLRVIYFGA